jgi:hypothetical protein
MVGIGLAILSLIGIAGVIAVDIVGAGKWNGFGPAQQQAIAACVITALIGLSLVPLGDRPA